MSNILSVPDAIEILASYGYGDLEKIPNLLIKIYENCLDLDFPEATKWLEEYYDKMKVSIRKEFEDGFAPTKTP
jgi:hypothetical protein